MNAESESEENFKEKLISWLNILSAIVFLISSVGFGVSFLLKHIPFMIFSMLIVVGVAYIVKKINFDYKNSSKNQEN